MCTSRARGWDMTAVWGKGTDTTKLPGCGVFLGLNSPAWVTEFPYIYAEYAQAAGSACALAGQRSLQSPRNLGARPAVSPQQGTLGCVTMHVEHLSGQEFGHKTSRCGHKEEMLTPHLWDRGLDVIAQAAQAQHAKRGAECAL